MNKLIEIQPATSVHATIVAPPSKSYTNRALIVAALANGESQLQNPLVSEDTKYMGLALRQFGLVVDQRENEFIVRGRNGRIYAPKEKIYVGNAGTTMRFLTTFSALALGETRLTGDTRMDERPIEDLLVCLRDMGVRAESVNHNQCPPVSVHGGPVPGGLVTLAGDKSSQYLTSLLLCAPYFQKSSTIGIRGELTSKSYVDITLDIMKTFGVTVQNYNYERFRIQVEQRYQPQVYLIEGDASSASYFFAAAAICGGEVCVTGLNSDSVQGDIHFVDVLEKMGCGVEKTKEQIKIKGNLLRGITVNMNTMPDTVQTLAVTALFAKGETVIHDIGNLRIKETDRIAALASELKRLGAEVEAGSDFIKIKPGTYHAAEVDTYNDHRMAMSFSLAGLKIPGIKIKNPECVEKSFPDYFDRFKSLYG
ncbi:MAG: 3-phosphoshikimate 1-carboxyvinyltransferase [Nitrospinota bacterium]|nr:3-phosphoshikimate 1-carboxyvinyltransferase [Nitrospinota bacterium]